MTEIPDTLVNGGDCPLHYHQLDRIPRQDFLHGLQGITRVKTTAVDVTVGASIDIVIATADCTVTFPIARGGRECRVKKYYAAGAGVVVTPTGTDTVEGAATYTLTGTGTVKLFKAVGTDWVIIG